MKTDGAAFDPETIELLLNSLDEAWSLLPPRERMRVSKATLAERILRAAANGERDPVRLRTRALIGVVHEPPAGKPAA